MKLIPKNWESFQHYKDRAPPWIKLHKGLLDDSVFQRFPVASRALAPMLWLLASESKDGIFDASLDELAFRLRQTEKEVDAALKPLILKGFFIELQDASEVLAGCKQVAVPEERREETEKSTLAAQVEETFNSFWTAWPSNDRKQDKKKCQEKWVSKKLHTHTRAILEDIDQKKLSEKWRNDGGRFIEAPLVYLNNERWSDGGSVQVAGGVLAGAI